MNKVLKVSLILLGSFILVLIGVASGAIVLDQFETRYLKLSNIADAETNSYLIKNVNVIAMTADTVMAQQMVLIQDGRITDVSPEISIDEVEVVDGFTLVTNVLVTNLCLDSTK
ncbi:hypothetical protein [Reichenbachiella ulvae]|uniref:Uncharacterized protein n=1 Tax=Reichenbachiella ulvae TaxID=2980104 RepID=A0ABT3CVG2_9BACT|nr:hypothetical protein [Reichenbachiella ulvae]MCV9387632.1 hypothetical protein [Reichenbachiella ulvae]